MKVIPNPFEVPAEVLARCDEEPIERPGAIQAHGALLVLDAHTHQVLFISDNADDVLGYSDDTAGSRPLDEMLTPMDESATLSELVAALPPGTSALTRCLRRDGGRCFAHLHHAGEQVLIDLEPAAPARMPGYLPSFLEAIARTGNLEDFALELTRQVSSLTGFDRVMVYRFDAAYNGEIIAETLASDVDSFMGMRFPASDIPPRARALYSQNRCRILVDRDAPAVALRPAARTASDVRADAIDLSRSHLRAVSPVHLEYLFNMGVKATLVASLTSDGELWGLIACHHYDRLYLDPAQRSTVETLSVAASGHILNLAHREREYAVAIARNKHGLLGDASERRTDWYDQLLELGNNLIADMRADGFCLRLDDSMDIRCGGKAPQTHTLLALTNALNAIQAGVHAFESLNEITPELVGSDPGCAGLLVIRPHPTSTILMIWTREERERKVTWAGRPEKSLVNDQGGVRLSPRKSFERWESEVAGYCEPWRERERALAETLFTQLASSYGTLLAREREEAIEARLQSEQKLAEASRRLVEALHTSPDAIVSFDLQGIIRAHNANAQRLLLHIYGIEIRDELNLVEAIGAPNNERLLGWLELARAGETFSHRIMYTLLDGSQKWLLVDGRPMLDSPTGGLVVSARDVTEDQVSAERARTLEMRMLHAQQMEGLSMLAGGVAHDFNNLLVGIRCNAELVVTDSAELEPEHREALADVIAASEMAAELTRQLLAYSGRGRGSVETFDLVELTRSMLHVTRARESRLEARIVSAPAELRISADATQVRQILLNLIVNALEAVDPRTGSVSVSLEVGHARELAAELERAQFNATTGAGQLAIIDVTDNGCGMDADTLGRVLEPFFSTRFTGRGLGLAAVVGVVRVHEGAILMRSAPGEGTSMRVYLPATGELSTGDYLTLEGGERAAILVGTISVMHPIAAALRRDLGLQTVLVESLTELVAVRDRLGRALRVAVLQGNHPLLRDGRGAQFLRSQAPDLMIIQLGGDRQASSASAISVHMEQWPPQAVVRIVDERLRLSAGR